MKNENTSRRKNKSLRFTREEAEKLINELFEFYGNPPYIREAQYKLYFKEYKGLSEEDITILIAEAAWVYELINTGIMLVNDKLEEVIWKPGEDELTMPELYKSLEEDRGKRRRY